MQNKGQYLTWATYTAKPWSAKLVLMSTTQTKIESPLVLMGSCTGILVHKNGTACIIRDVDYDGRTMAFHGASFPGLFIYSPSPQHSLLTGESPVTYLKPVCVCFSTVRHRPLTCLASTLAVPKPLLWNPHIPSASYSSGPEYWTVRSQAPFSPWRAIGCSHPTTVCQQLYFQRPALGSYWEICLSQRHIYPFHGTYLIRHYYLSNSITEIS